MTVNNFLWYFSGFLSIIEGIWTLLGGKTFFRLVGWKETSIEYSIFAIIFGIVIIFFTKKHIKINTFIEHSKCPNCKETFNYTELKNGKCKYCDEIDTIEIDEYYKKYPEELKDI